MADFSTPFGDNSEKRLPTTTEKTNGFPCDAADQRLFNGMFHQIQSELKAIHDAGGVAGDDGVFNTTLLNIQALIDAATGNGNTEGYLLLSQAVARLPIFPEFITSDGKINVTSPAAGTVRIPSGVTFMHRGIKPIVTTEIDFNTDASKTYHLRWDPTNGYRLRDLADSSYNINISQETEEKFDTQFDDMLISRIITNTSNVATITNLINKTRLISTAERASTVGDGGTTYNGIIYTQDFARTPMANLETILAPGSNRDSDYILHVSERTRYQIKIRSWSWTAGITTSPAGHNSPGYKYNILAV